MNALQSYQFESQQFRVITDENGDPLFVAKDVCNILGYANSSDMIKKLCRNTGISNRYIPALSNTYTLIDEGNLYRLIIKSNKPESESFESWVCDDVLPSIRKTGSYGIPEALTRQLGALQAEVLRVNPRLDDVLKLTRLGYSQARIADMLHIGETSIYRSVCRLRECGFVVCADSALSVKHGISS